MMVIEPKYVGAKVIVILTNLTLASSNNTLPDVGD